MKKFISIVMVLVLVACCGTCAADVNKAHITSASDIQDLIDICNEYFTNEYGEYLMLYICRWALEEGYSSDCYIEIDDEYDSTNIVIGVFENSYLIMSNGYMTVGIKDGAIPYLLLSNIKNQKETANYVSIFIPE